MSPVFGRFGRRRDEPGDHEPDPWLDDPVPARDDRRPGPAHPDRWAPDRDPSERSEKHPSAAGRSGGRPSAAVDPAGTAVDPAGADLYRATRAASPAVWGPRRPDLDDEPDTTVDDPVTDPFGFPPIPPVLGPDPSPADPVPAWAAWVPPASGPSIVAVPAAVPPAGDPAERPPGGGAGDPGPSGPGDEPDARLVTSSAPEATAPDGTEPDHTAPDRTDPPLPRRTIEPRPVPVATPGGPPADRRQRPEPSAGPGPSDGVPAAPVAAPVVLHAADPDVAEAAALAAAFAADYLSWDEDDPARRGRALAEHLPGPATDRALLGWAGTGRQRAEIVLSGAVRPDGDDRFLVDVRVRVTPYRRVSRSEPAPEPEPGDALGTTAAAPPVTARGWRGLAARWVRLGVTVARDGDRLVVDVGEETVDGGHDDDVPVRTPARAVVVEDPTLDGDDDPATGRSEGHRGAATAASTTTGRSKERRSAAGPVVDAAAAGSRR